MDEKVKQLSTKIKSESIFDRKSECEAFADNIARMYGYSAPLMKALKKLDGEYKQRLANKVKKEKKRQEIIIDMALAEVNDEHKTIIHRTKALIKEYEDDLKDPNLSAELRKHLSHDKIALEAVLEDYISSGDTFTNVIYQTINDELNDKYAEIKANEKQKKMLAKAVAKDKEEAETENKQ